MSRRKRIGDAPLDPPGYAARVAEYEALGMTRSDAQGTADADHRLGRLNTPLQKIVTQPKRK